MDHAITIHGIPGTNILMTTDSTPAASTAPPAFSAYQRFAAVMLALLQFAVILDFMLMSPLGALIMPTLSISPQQFGLVVSAYAFSAGISGLLTAGFADRFDRKKLLLFFYVGFMGGTLWCGLANSFEMLLAARIVTGLFGGVIGSIVMAITTDLFPLNLRGRAMGLLQTGFAASQVLGLPMGLYLATRWDWHAPFIALVIFGLFGGLLIAWRLKPVDAHLALPQEHSAWQHLLRTIAQPRHVLAFTITGLLSTGGFMLMPFASAFVVNNVHIALDHLPIVYLITGISTLVIAPSVGKLSDRFGPLKVFYGGSTIAIATVLYYTQMGPSSLLTLIIVNVVMFAGIFSRMIPWQVMSSSIPSPEQRGSYSSISAALQQLAGGLGSLVAGHLVHFAADGRLEHFERVGYVVVASTLLAGSLMWWLKRGMPAAAAH